MRLIWDASILTMYPVAGPGFKGGTENMIIELTRRLAEKGHTVHVVCRDLEQEEQRGPNLWYWPQAYHPTEADVVIMTQQILPDSKYQADSLVLAHTGCDPYLGPNGEWAEGVDAWPVFSAAHKEMLIRQRPTIPAERVHVVGLGVNLEEYQDANCWDCCIGGSPPDCGRRSLTECITSLDENPKVPGRLLYANDPMRGLFYLLDIFDIVQREVPEASLHIAYDFDRQSKVHEWEHSYKAQLTHEMKRRIESTPGVVNLGNLSREELIREQLECQVHCMPSDPPNLGTQTHGITQAECAAAGAALVLSDVEAFPEVFGEAAIILPVIGYFEGETLKRRIDANDYAQAVIELMRDPEKWQEASRKARALAERHTWERCANNWESMLLGLRKAVPA